MQIVRFEEKWIPQAMELLKSNYEEEKHHVPSLPEIKDWWELDKLAANGLGVAAVQERVLLGYLAGYGPWGPVFCTPDTLGVLSPLHAHAAQKTNRVKLYQRMYQAAAEKWVTAGAASHTVVLFAHDAEAREAFSMNGFGVRCLDLFRMVERIAAEPPAGYRFYELPAEKSYELHPLRRELIAYLEQSPCFMKQSPEQNETWLGEREKEPPRMFVAEADGAIHAYMELQQDGENFVSCQSGIWNICGAYCLPALRGKGIAAGLLSYLSGVLLEEGAVRMGVDCESINPNAFGFWQKYFDIYTTGVVRRIDENVLGKA